MQLICPECSEQVKAENINVQEMIAVCQACDNVFQFNISEPKSKRRKVHQPHNMTVHDTDTLQIAYRTNFRLDKNEAFLSSLFGSVFLTFLTLTFTEKYFSSDIPFMIPLMFGMITLAVYYVLGLVAFNKTHLEMDDELIKISRRPLPSLFNTSRSINLSGVVSIYSEETAISQKEAYDTPRYHVWAELADSNRKLIVTDVIEDYAIFIAQRLHERLDTDADIDVSRLVEGEQSIEHEHNLNEVIESSHSININHNHNHNQ